MPWNFIEDVLYLPDDAGNGITTPGSWHSLPSKDMVYALEQLRQTSSKAEFTAQALAVVEHIRRMWAEIDAYPGIMEVELAVGDP